MTAIENQTPPVEGVPRAGKSWYWPAQLAYWGMFGATLLASSSVAADRFHPVFAALTALLIGQLLIYSHVLRSLYRQLASDWPLWRIVRHLLWALPLIAVLIQCLQHAFVFATLLLEPSLYQVWAPLTWPSALMYWVNTLIMLTLWCLAYLIVAQYGQRRQTELAYWKTRAQLREAELQFLRGQINSHFLFNAINNLRSLIREAPDTARERLTQLAALLRAVLQVERREKVSLREEMEWVRAYLALEGLQLEDRLEVTIDVDDNTLDADIPPLLLQTLVENAVRHGLARCPEGGELRITADCRAHNLFIRVENTAPPTPSPGDGLGIGIDNAKARLQRVFGAAASLCLQQRAQTFTAELRIPFSL